MKKALSFLIIGVVVFGLLAACSNSGGDDETITIGASILTQSHPFYVAIKEAIEEEANNQGANIEISIADQDLNRQISAVEDFINRNVDVIILTPVDSDGVQGAIRRAQEANIPVVTVDIQANGVDVDSHIATDNFSGGMIAAEALAQFIGETGDVGLITYPEVQSVRDRIEGFKLVATQYPELNIVVELPGRTREEAKSAAEDMLTANPNLSGIFGFGDDMAIAASTAIGERGAGALVVGFDGMEEAINSVDSDNAFEAVVVQFPDQMGAEGVKNAVKLAKGESVEKEVPITPGLYIHGEGFVEVMVEDGQVIIER